MGDKATRVPPWLNAKEAARGQVTYSPDAARVKVVRRIFDLCLQGLSAELIAHRLNIEDVATFGRSKQWSRSSIASILRSTAVLGQVAKHKSEQAEQSSQGSRQRTAKPFPQIIDDKTYRLAQLPLAERISRYAKLKKSNAINLFSKLVWDVATEKPMRFEHGKAGPQLISATASDEPQFVVAYDCLEQRFLQHLDMLPLSQATPKQQGDKDRTLADVSSEVRTLEKHLISFEKAQGGGLNPESRKAIKEAKSELQRRRRSLAALESDDQHAVRKSKDAIADYCKSLALGEDLSPHRRKLRKLLPQWIKRVYVLPLKVGVTDAAVVKVELASGACIDFRIATKDHKECSVDWPKALNEDIAHWAKWPAASRKRHWTHQLTVKQKRILELDKLGLSVELIAYRSKLPIAEVARELKELGKTRPAVTTVGKGRPMIWWEEHKEWVRFYNGSDYRVSAAELMRVYPKSAVAPTEEGTRKAVNQWWNSWGGGWSYAKSAHRSAKAKRKK